jgi:hypothetical protein
MDTSCSHEFPTAITKGNAVDKFSYNPVRGTMHFPADIDLSDIDFDPLPEASAQRLAPGAALGIEKTTRRARPTRKRIPYGHAIRKMLSVK